MILSRRPALNGVYLDELDERILIQGVEGAAGKESVNAVSVWGAGQRMTGEHRDYMEVSVTFSMLIRRTDLQARSELFERACAWAASGHGGWLTLNYRQNRRLWVDYVVMPAMGDVTRWTNRYTFTFRAYSVPYWQQNPPTTLRLTGVNVRTTSIGVEGSARTVMGVEFKNTSGLSIGTFRITCGNSTIALSALGLGNGETLVIDHTEDGILRIRISSAGGVYRSALAKRTAESSDDLYVDPGTVSVSLSAQYQGTLTLSCAGRFVG